LSCLTARGGDHFGPLKLKSEIVRAFLDEKLPAPSAAHPLNPHAAKTMCWKYCTSTAALKSQRDRDAFDAAQ
jgi:hypothetical protein